MKRRKIKGRCYIKGKQRGYLRRMRQKEREREKMERYNRNVANLFGDGDGVGPVEYFFTQLRERRKELAAEREREGTIRTPGENPADWLPLEYPGLFFAL
jgi:hypothetical protein